MKHQALAIMALAAASAATAGTSSGTTADGSTWEAASMIVGVGSTANKTSGYNPTMPQHNGIAHLTMRYANGTSAGCTGSLMSDRIHIVTAAHCLGTSGSAGLTSTTVRFFGGTNPDTDVSRVTSNTRDRIVIAASSSFVHPDYTGQVVDQNDIAVIRLASAAPAWVRSYDLATDIALGGQGFQVAGYGLRSNTGGSVGSNVTGGRLRVGQNDFDIMLGDPAYGGYFTSMFGSAAKTFTFLSDFDNGLAANDAGCRVFGVCGLGRGFSEVAVAPGDSGGPAFVGNRLAAITSFGLSFGTSSGDVKSGLNSSFGEFSGFVPLSIHSRFLGAVTGLSFAAPVNPQQVNGGFQSVATGYTARAANLSVPEPGSWLMLIIGFGLVGASMRRRRAARA